MATILNAVSGTGLTQTADGSGVMKVQSNGVTTNALAWVNFNGTSATPITPRANYNISSVTKNGTGDYTLNFTSALSDANYTFAGGATGTSSWYGVVSCTVITNQTATALRVIVWTASGSTQSAINVDAVNVVVFGN